MNEKEQNLTKQLPLKQNWFTRATLGAAMADSPTVMTASGWRRNDNGDYVQDKFDDPATNRLADNLGIISSIAQAGPTLIDDATLLYQVVRHPQQTWRTLSTGIKEAANKLIRRRPKTSASITTTLNGVTLYTPDEIVKSGDFSKGKEMAAKFFEHPVVQESYKHNLELAKRLGIILPDKDAAKVVRELPVVVKFANLDGNEMANVTRTYFGNPDDIITMNWNRYPLKDLRLAVIHENLHRGYYGAPLRPEKLPKGYYESIFKPEYSFYKWKTEKLLKPGLDDGYLTDVLFGEAGPNLIDMGRDLGLKLGQKYPGYEAAKQMLLNYNGFKSFLVPRLNDTKAGMRHVWDAMTGKYFTPIVGLGAGIYGITTPNEQ